MGNVMIETPRLILREFDPEDLAGLYSLYEESDTRFLQPLSENREEELEKLKSYIHYIYGFYGFGLWVVCLKESGRLIGRCGLQVEFIQDQGEYELGYMISGKYGRKGYGKEAVTAILEYAEEELEAPRVILRIDTENEPSRRFAENMGFRLMTEATEKKSDVCLYIYDL